MDSSLEMFNRSSYFPIYPYPLSVTSEISSFRSDNNVLTNDYSSYCHPDNISSTYPSTIYTNSLSHSPINHSNTAGDDISIPRFNNNVSSLLVSRSDRCLVCNDRASGIHFGVSTCEACKAFFRRTNLSSYSIPHPCSPIRCEINARNRNNCPSCRFDKCKRLGMDRENVIYGKPSKQQLNSPYQQDHFLEQLTNISNELLKIFQNIDFLYNSSSNEIKQQIDTFGQTAFQLFYPQLQNVNSSDVINLILELYNKYGFISDYYLIQNLNLRALLTLWLFVYYYETFFFKDKISQEKLTILIKLLDMELVKVNGYYGGEEENKEKKFRIHFINTFTKFADRIQQTHLNK